MRPRLPALEKNILKYRALQMVLLLHQVESLRTFVIGSIRGTDALRLHDDVNRLPGSVKRPMKKALAVLVREGIITGVESEDVEKIIDLRNKIGHTIHDLVTDISAPQLLAGRDPMYDYFALRRFERYRDKIATGMAKHFVLKLDLRDFAFEQAEATYKEELERLRKRINKQFEARRVTGRRDR